MRQESAVQQIERAIGNNMTRISAPQPKDLVLATVKRAINQILTVDADVLEGFRPVVRAAVEANGGDAEQLLCRAVAEIAGVRTMTYRSMLSSSDGFKTFLYKSTQRLRSPGKICFYYFCFFVSEFFLRLIYSM